MKLYYVHDSVSPVKTPQHLAFINNFYLYKNYISHTNFICNNTDNDDHNKSADQFNSACLKREKKEEEKRT